MAKKKTSKTDQTPPDDTLADKATEPNPDPNAEVLEEPERVDEAKGERVDSPTDDIETAPHDVKAVPDDVEDAAGTSKDVTTPNDTSPDGSSAQDGAKAEDAETDNVADGEGSDTSEITKEAVSEASDQAPRTSTPEASAPAEAEKVVVKQGGFFPMVFGGIAAGAVGFAAAYFGLAERPDAAAGLGPRIDELAATVDLQAQTVDGLATRLDALPAAPDLAPIEGQIAEIAAQAADLGAAVSANEAALAALNNKLEDIDSRLTQVEQQPVTQGASEAAVAAYERELQSARDQIEQQSEAAREQIAKQSEALREQLEQQRDEMQAQRAQLEALISEALSTENEAEQASMEAMRRAAISQIIASVENGTPFSDALSDLESTGMESPEALTAVAEDGAPSAAALQAEFPDLARRALSASRSAAAQSGEAGGFSDFLRSQLGARSLEPREGNDPDAVLSRAEAAVREGRLNDALAEIQALPEVGQAVMTDWVQQANRRLDAINAAQDLSEKLN